MVFLAVIDTNVIVSALLKKHLNNELNEKTNPALILDYISQDIIIPFINSHIFIEYVYVLNREELNIDKKYIFEVIDLFLEKSRFIKNMENNIQLTDKSDVKFYAVTLSARKNDDAYLVTGNKRHFPVEPFVVSPREMVEIIESQSK